MKFDTPEGKPNIMEINKDVKISDLSPIHMKFFHNLLNASGKENFTEAARDWKVYDKDKSREFLNCHLCGVNIKKNVTIKNKQNANMLIIGTDCFDKLLAFIVTGEIKSIQEAKGIIDPGRRHFKKNAGHVFLDWFEKEEKETKLPENIVRILTNIRDYGFPLSLQDSEEIINYYKLNRKVIPVRNILNKDYDYTLGAIDIKHAVAEVFGDKVKISEVPLVNLLYYGLKEDRRQVIDKQILEIERQEREKKEKKRVDRNVASFIDYSAKYNEKEEGEIENLRIQKEYEIGLEKEELDRIKSMFFRDTFGREWKDKINCSVSELIKLIDLCYREENFIPEILNGYFTEDKISNALGINPEYLEHLLCTIKTPDVFYDQRDERATYSVKEVITALRKDLNID